MSGAALASVLAAANAHAQSTPIPDTGMTAFGYRAGQSNLAGMNPVIDGHLVVNADSVRAIVERRSRPWLDTLAARPVGYLHEIPMAGLAAFLNDDAGAQRFLDARLATPGLTVQERLWTLGTAFDMLLPHSQVQTPARIALAKRYLAQIDAIPIAESGRLRFGARIELMLAYQRRTEFPEAMKWGWEAHGLGAQLPTYDQRSHVSTNGNLYLFALMLASTPNGLHTIDSLLTVLQGYVPPPASLIASDSLYRYYAVGVARQFAELSEKVKLLGKRNTAVMAMHWYNMPAPATPYAGVEGAQLKTLDDGIIRIVGFGWFTCPGCRQTMKIFNTIQHQLPPGAQVLYVERTEGEWGGNAVTPAEETEHIRHHVQDVMHYTFPFAIWAGPKETTPEGWHVVQRFPMIDPYHLESGPSFLIVDGHGTVRAWYGPGDPFSETDGLRIIKMLVAERDQERAGATGAAPSAQGVAHE